jgi:hypothetical protein
LSDREPQSQASGAQGPEGLPKFDYYIDESDPDTVILRRQDGAFVAAFSAGGATKEGIIEAVKEDYRQLVEAYAAQQSQEEEDTEEGQASAQSS